MRLCCQQKSSILEDKTKEITRLRSIIDNFTHLAPKFSLSATLPTLASSSLSSSLLTLSSSSLSPSAEPSTMDNKPENGVKPNEFTCEICLKKFETVQRKAKHIPIHDENPRFRCGSCGHQFFLESTLLCHRGRSEENCFLKGFS